MGLRSTPFNKCLSKKLLVLGFEIPDVLAIFLVLSTLNFALGPLGHLFLLVWSGFPPSYLPFSFG